MDLSIIIVSWNVQDKLKENLKALYKSQGDFSFEIIVVDNNSADKTAEMIKNEFPQVKIIANSNNLGFAKANNQALKIAQGNFILLLNPDMQVNSFTLFNMLNWMSINQRAAVASCKLLDKDNGTIKHVRRFPSFFDQLAIALKLPHFFQGILKNYILEDFDYEQASVVDSIRGGFMMIRKNVVDKVGLFDESFFLWFEEVDFCRRVKKANMQVWYTPAAVCVDYVGQSFAQVETLTKQKYFRDSMLKYFRKWYPFWQHWILWCAWWFGLFFSWAAIKNKKNSKANT